MKYILLFTHTHTYKHTYIYTFTHSGGVVSHNTMHFYKLYPSMDPYDAFDLCERVVDMDSYMFG
jgi:hypothetical protein